jgi:uncharacterized tellurite resistance protein B-like protein
MSNNDKIALQNEAQACTLVLLACLQANELGSTLENPVFRLIVGRRNTFQGHDGTQLIQHAAAYYAQAPTFAQAIDAAVGHIQEHTRLPLFYQCLELVMEDGVVTPMEHRVVQYLLGKLKIDPELAYKGMEVLGAKTRL